MPAKNPRINIVLEQPMYKQIHQLAEMDHMSMSGKIRDLLKEALEIHEDIGLSAIAQERETTWDDSGALTHEDVWT